MKILNEYPTHHYWEEYLLGKLYCPNCGEQKVWEEQSSGDYYCGPDYLCSACGSNFKIQGPYQPTPKDGLNVIKKVDQLITGISLKPSTPEGQ